MKKNLHLLKGIMLISGTSIGGGMLALPVLTSLTGFLPSIVVYFLCWAFMASTGLLMLEACAWVKEDANLVSMASFTLGQTGKAAAWFLYLFLFYCLTIAYISGCGDLVAELINVPSWLGSILFIGIFAPIIFVGAQLVSRFNLFFMIGLTITYLVFVVLGFPNINAANYAYKDWSYAVMAFPIAFTAFAYQGIVPTLFSFLHRNVRMTRQAILIGSFIPFVVYVIWEALILGIVPTFGPGGLEEALQKGENAVYPIRNFIQNPAVYIVGQFFAFFALVTSFLGVTLGLKDFLADGLNIKKDVRGRLLLISLVLFPPLLFTFIYPGIFLSALDYAGGLGCALLLGLMPILMVWSGRYVLKLHSKRVFPGGKIVLSLLIMFVIFEIACLIATKLEV